MRPQDPYTGAIRALVYNILVVSPGSVSRESELASLLSYLYLISFLPNLRLEAQYLRYITLLN